MSITILKLSCAALYMSLILGTAAQTDQGSSDDCRHVFQLKKGDNVHLHLHNFTKSHGHTHYCTLQATAEKDMLVVLDLIYVPPRPSGNSPSLSCNTDYVHVGNDPGRVDVNLMTSYKFCQQEIRHELISRANHMWLVLKSSQLPKEFIIKVKAESPVVCTDRQFACSPVQCVDRSSICDGVRDCDNGHDEFCHRVGVDSPSRIQSQSCFRCGDGTCIQPRLSVYDVNHGRVLWYLCDGFSHCPDAWDERKDICNNLRSGRVGSVTECVPYDLQFGRNGSVMMWNEIRCDDNPDCYHGDDETGCYGRNSQTSRLRFDPVTIGVIAAIVGTVCAVGFFIYRIKTTVNSVARPSTSSTVDTMCTHCTTAGEEDNSGMVTSDTEGQGCVDRDCPGSPVRKTVPLHEGNTRVDVCDEDEGSVCSLDLKHTTV